MRERGAGVHGEVRTYIVVIKLHIDVQEKAEYHAVNLGKKRVGDWLIRYVVLSSATTA